MQQRAVRLQSAAAACKFLQTYLAPANSSRGTFSPFAWHDFPVKGHLRRKDQPRPQLARTLHWKCADMLPLPANLLQSSPRLEPRMLLSRRNGPCPAAVATLPACAPAIALPAPCCRMIGESQRREAALTLCLEQRRGGSCN